MLSASIGPDKPLTVNESSYHIFVVQFSADNMNFSLEINSATILTHTSSSTTVRHTCTGPEHPTDYIAICKAPLYVTAHPEAASIHIQSWGSQYWWDIVAFIIFLFMSICASTASCGICVWRISKKRYPGDLQGCRIMCIVVF